jgi:hypothetical protein
MRKGLVFIVSIGFTILVASRLARGNDGAAADLYTLARNHFTPQSTSDGERKAFDIFFQRVQEGKKADLTPDVWGVTESTDVPTLLDPRYACEWGDSRVIKAEWINWLCRDVEASKKVTSRGIEIDEARIAGPVDLSWLKLEFPIIIFKCQFTDNILLNRASLRSLQLQTTYLKSLYGDFLNVQGDVFFANQCFAEGVVWLREARIAGILNCEDSQFVNPGRTALYLMDAKTGSVYLRKYQEGFHAEGEVKLEEATIGGSLDCSGGQFINPAGAAIDAMRANIRGSVFLQNFESQGQITFQDAQIEKEFCLSEGVWGPDAVLDLTSAKAKTLLNKDNGWPAQNNLRLHAFTFDELHKNANLDADVQTRWILRQPPDTFRAQPFEQMAKVLRSMGREEEASEAMVDKNWDYGCHIGFRLSDALWYHILGPLIGYGYYPWNAFYWSLFLIVLGWVLFNAGYWSGLVTPTGKDAYKAKDTENEDHLSEQDLSKFYPRFSALVYSLETFVPLLKLWMSDYWTPNATERAKRLKIVVGSIKWQICTFKLPINGPGLRVYLWVHVAAGWVLTTLWVGGLTGLLKT